ncbi:MAG: CDP-diacylglycerol--glycerol-3-phosphate 3-phosphatidyltransferase [Bacillota bacterium]|jgi:CDP-diacylglycerol--glycerol-3-phosphate 3-phosphatidyltransferase
MNLANRITLIRICLIPVFLIVLYLLPQPFNFMISSFIFIAAAATDGIDGYIARNYNMVTNLGKFMDPLADKLLVAAAFIAFVDLSLLTAWIVIVILSREFIITGLRAIAAEKGVVIAASAMGKFKTVSQIVAIVLLLWLAAGWLSGNVWQVIVQVIVYLALFFTVYSGIEYIYNGRSFLFKDR